MIDHLSIYVLNLLSHVIDKDWKTCQFPRNRIGLGPSSGFMDVVTSILLSPKIIYVHFMMQAREPMILMTNLNEINKWLRKQEEYESFCVCVWGGGV